jgi:transposase
MHGEVYYRRYAGIDVHKKVLVVCLRIGRKSEIRTFGTLTHELRNMVAWLKDNDCQMAAMESTGSYWKPLYNIFEQEGLPAMVCNAHHIKNVPGRKTDVKDAEWIAKCLSQGLLNPSFIPDREQRELRELTRFRQSQIQERSRNINRLQKFLEGANIKIGSWLSDVEGKSATELLELVIGKPDFTVDDVAARMHKNMKSSAEELFLSLEGYMTPLQRELFAHIMEIIRQQTAQIEKTDAMIKRNLNGNYKAAIKALDEIPGIGEISAEQIIAEVGTDMSRFRTPQRLSKWAGVCPGNNESAGKRKSGKTPPGNKTLKSTLTQSAQSAKRKKDSFFHAQYNRLVTGRGKNKATMAVAHSLLIAIFFVLSGKQFVDLGADYYTNFNREKKINSHVKQLSKLGVNIPEDVMRNIMIEAMRKPDNSRASPKNKTA